LNVSITITGPVIIVAGLEGALMTLQESIDAMTAKVAAAETVEAGAKTFIADLANQLRALANAPDQINALAARLDASNGNLQSALVVNTPAAPPASGTSEAGPTDTTA
jgi:hypothetical protein